MYPISFSLRCFGRAATSALKCMGSIAVLFCSVTVSGQTVTEIITDYNGYWKSGPSAINAVKPDNSHNLLSFSYNGVRYSTGANDSILTARGNTFTPCDFKALPVSQITGAVNSNTKIGLGASYDGVPNGASNPRPENNMTKYLTDGVKGLDLGTCVANLPAGNLFFPIANLTTASISDGIPDLLITQVADPSGSALDSYEFTDINGNRVGNKVDIVLSGLPVLGNWTVDFYEAGTNPMTLTSGYTKTDRAIRLWVADFSAFGISSSNINQVAYFKIRLNGNSDVAFVSYNNSTVNIMNNALPVQLTSFTGSVAQQQVQLKWQTATEINSDRFVIETSKDGVQFTSIDSVNAAGMSSMLRFYSYTQQHPKAGKWFYRLKQVDKNGWYNYSSIVTISYAAANEITLSVYPNPVVDKVYINHPHATGTQQCQLVSMQGVVLSKSQPVAGSRQTSFDVRNLPSGTYMLVWKDGSGKQVKSILKP